MAGQSYSEFVSFHEQIVEMMVSFLEYVLTNYTTLVPRRDVEILANIGELYHAVPKLTTIVVDSPNINNASLYDPNLVNQKKYIAGLHTFMLNGNFLIHFVDKKEIAAQRLASLVFMITIAKEMHFSKYGFSELKPVGIGSTIVLNPEESEDVWYDVPLSFTFTTNITVNLENVLRQYNQVKIDVNAPTRLVQIRLTKAEL